MRCLTVRQYWAWAIIAGLKPAENRTWSTSYRGPLAIHAGQSLDPTSRATLEALGFDVPGDVTRGTVLGTVDLVAVVPWQPGTRNLPGVEDEWGLADDPLATGPFCWILRNPKPLAKPVPMSGKQGLYEIDLP